ncbi:MAG: MBL fold metallo-hydrolase [Alistipes sp.]|nr:MBL fold metallo-hydrolase [Alistipes sp.]
MAALFCSAFGANFSAKAASYPSDEITTRDGMELKITFFGHGSIAFEFEGRHIYVDPVSDYADYSRLPKADVILVTHEHGDHLDPTAIEALWKPDTSILGSATAIETLGKGDVLVHGESAICQVHTQVANGADTSDLIYVAEAIPAYNTSPSQLQFHPRGRNHNGYILTFGGTRVYVAGDTEDTPEMLALKDIDIAFLPVNQPYTMTEEQAARAVQAISPGIFYPYHYGGTDHTTDLDKLARLIENSGVEMRIRPLE